MIGILDCGTTNAKLFLLKDGILVSETYQKLGLKDYALPEQKPAFRQELRHMILRALAAHGWGESALTSVIAYGMITSEIGLRELDHLVAPVSMQALQEGVFRCKEPEILSPATDFYYIRGVRNALKRERDIRNIFICDYMRGEETQVAGVMRYCDPACPFTVFILGSHSKYVCVDAKGRITESRTTLSGQIYECLLQYTVVGKSVQPAEGESLRCTLEELLALAREDVTNNGFMRAAMTPRFMERFTSFNGYERRAYLGCVVAIEDMLAGEAYLADMQGRTIFILGQKERAAIYTLLFKQRYGDGLRVVPLDTRETIRDVDIAGALYLANAIKEY